MKHVPMVLQHYDKNKYFNILLPLCIVLIIYFLMNGFIRRILYSPLLFPLFGGRVGVRKSFDQKLSSGVFWEVRAKFA